MPLRTIYKEVNSSDIDPYGGSFNLENGMGECDNDGEGQAIG